MKKLWRTLNVYTAMIIVMTVGTVVSLFINIQAFIILASVTAICIVVAIIENIRSTKTLEKYISWVSDTLSGEHSKALGEATVPMLITGETGEIVWYNEAFKATYADANILISKNFNELVGDEAAEQLNSSKYAEITLGNVIYKVYKIATERSGIKVMTYVFFDITSHRILRKQYEQSRPVICIMEIDNLDDVVRSIKDADAVALKSSIHNAIQKWSSETKGIFRRIYGDRYMLVIDERDAGKITADKFSILSAVKEIKVGEHTPTLSIGVGRGAETFAACEELAVQALEMAQSRGGDQAAVKSLNGEYKFFGGLAAAQEKHTKTRARVVASALRDLIKGSDNVIVMGHKYADLDSLGSAYGLYSLSESLGADAYLALDSTANMAKSLLARIVGVNPDFSLNSFEELCEIANKKTLLIITDVHRAALTEYPELIERCGSVVVIDHHRRAVDYIEGSVLFYHETSASSASEMVTELIQYANSKAVGQLEAEALLSGIMLDSRNFVMNAGARTFEAAAFLRTKGADPIAVKKLFSGSMSAYKQRANIVATAQIYGNAAIAVDTERDENTRLATAQAADELLGISDVAASFVLCKLGDSQINISARSLGSVNVQLIMESLGGGGHRTMAACQLSDVGFEEAAAKLKEAIDQYRINISK